MRGRTGGRHLAETIDRGIPFEHGIWIDSYNRSWSRMAGTVTTGVDYRCQNFVQMGVLVVYER